MAVNENYFWKQNPFIKLIIPFVAGIIIQFNAHYSLTLLWWLAAICLCLLPAFYLLKLSRRFTLRWVQGVIINALLIIAGALCTYAQDIKNNERWVGHYTDDSIAVLATIQEPLVDKTKSYKAEAKVEYVNANGDWRPAKGTILLYISKDSGDAPPLKYGSQVIFTKPLQEIKNSGNPGNFNYKQFNAFKDIYHQVFLKKNEYVIAPSTNINSFQQWLFQVRTFVIAKLQQYIPGEREAGVAEALLIGYRDDLDKDLVQAYSNTGVVHIIAISGLHLGMIYAVLVFFFRPFKKKRWVKWTKPVVILGVLWIFTLLAGAVPSILRSAVMFTFIIAGETFSRKSSVYNTLASSAFVMLCFNPYFLWDIGFQLSFVAVVSIVTFSKPVYNWLHVENKMLDFVWSLTSVTISAQILTVPILFYSFHQFPNLFLITNCVVVPLSTIVLFAELVVLIASQWHVAGNFFGIITGFLLKWMNNFIEKMGSFRYAVTDQIQNSLSETVLLYIVIVFISFWLMRKKYAALLIGVAAFFLFILLDAVEAYHVRQQQKMIVYNVPKQTAIDFISGRNYSFVGDSLLTQDGYLRNFHLKPARTLYNATVNTSLPDLFITKPFIQFNNYRILLLDKPYKFDNEKSIEVNAVIITKNPKLNIADIANVFECKEYVFDGSNSLYKINQWKKECDSLHLHYHVCSDNGAFEMNL